MEKEIKKFSDMLISIHLKDHFGNLVDFVKKYAKERMNQEQQMVEEVKQVTAATDNYRLIENISQDVSLSWNKRYLNFMEYFKS